MIVTLSLLGAVLVWSQTRSPAVAMMASSHLTGHGADRAAPGADGSWRPKGVVDGSWLQRTWDGDVDVRRIVIRGSSGAGAGALAGYVRFSDGSQVRVELPAGGATSDVAITPRRVTWMRFTFAEVADGVTSAGVAELDADDEDDPRGSITADIPSDGNVAATGDLTGASSALVDGRSDTAASVGTSVTLRFLGPREITRVAIAGADGGPTLKSGTLTFSDGSTLPVGAVTTDAERPTVVAFMARSTTSLRLSVNSLAGRGSLRLSELAAYASGAAPDRPLRVPATSDTEVPATPACSAVGPRPTDKTGVEVRCPTNGASVDGLVRLSVAAGPSYTHVSAVPWGDGSGVGAIQPTEADLDANGGATLTVDAAKLAAGPFVVAVTASGRHGQTATAYLQLVRPGSVDQEPADSPAGRTLVFQDDFDEPLSASRTGDGAEYAVGKPEQTDVTDFGDAPFADPALGLHDVAQQNGYLRLAVQPGARASTQGPAQAPYVGGMIASARPGGSGFSSQYGYFETRMLAPAEPGTWPAFWLLTMPDLVETQPVVGEIDAVELYGHDPVSACHTSHQYPDPDHVGKALCGQRWSSPREALQWHTYGVDVRPDRTMYYIDGVLVGDAAAVAGTDEPMFFMLDLALGGGWPVDLTSLRGRSALYVDWVRVYV